jgi:hypothetical protein
MYWNDHKCNKCGLEYINNTKGCDTCFECLRNDNLKAIYDSNGIFEALVNYSPIS